MGSRTFFVTDSEWLRSKKSDVLTLPGTFTAYAYEGKARNNWYS